MTTWPPPVNVVPTTLAVYPRLVSVSRMNTVAGQTPNFGNVGYSGAEQNTGIEGETVLYTGLVAAIELTSSGRSTRSASALPGDVVTRAIYNIFIPNIAIYSIRDRDLIYDDEGYRYEVGSNYWTQLGYQLSTIRQEI